MCWCSAERTCAKRQRCTCHIMALKHPKSGGVRSAPLPDGGVSGAAVDEAGCRAVGGARDRFGVAGKRYTVPEAAAFADEVVKPEGLLCRLMNRRGWVGLGPRESRSIRGLAPRAPFLMPIISIIMAENTCRRRRCFPRESKLGGVLSYHQDCGVLPCLLHMSRTRQSRHCSRIATYDVRSEKASSVRRESRLSG